MNTPLSQSERLTIPRIRKHRRLRVLSSKEAAALLALAETIFPEKDSGMPSVTEAQVVEYVDDMLSRLALKERLLVRCLIALLEVQMVAFNGLAPKLFSSASAEERTANLKGWETSRIFQRRLVFMAIRTLLLFAYVDSREAERDMGFHPGTHVIRRRNEVLALAKDTLRQIQSAEPRPATAQPA